MTDRLGAPQQSDGRPQLQDMYVAHGVVRRTHRGVGAIMYTGQNLRSDTEPCRLVQNAAPFGHRDRRIQADQPKNAEAEDKHDELLLRVRDVVTTRLLASITV